MKISIISVFPELYDQFLKTSLIKRAQEKELVTINVDGYFSFVEPKERIDDASFGPGAGMLIKPEVVQRAVEAKEKEFGPAFKIFFSPYGKKIDQRLLENLAQMMETQRHVMLLPARYEGMDSRVEEHYADLIVSIGDFVIMGGDLPAMVLLEGMLRFIPEVVGKKESVERDSFTGPFVDYPEYTAPIDWLGLKVPEVIRSGNHGEIERWRQGKAAERTVVQHFDWLRSHAMNAKQKNLAKQYIPPHYAVLMHTDVMLPDDRVGTTSVTSLDLHDGARSACTYGLKSYFIVTPLEDQQKIVKTLLDFWQTGPGKAYNSNRFEAVNRVRLTKSLAEVIADITETEGVSPIVVGTSARFTGNAKIITYYEQSLVWQERRPVLLVFGTGNGLSSEILEGCDYLLMPIEGFSDFNHLSVRSAMAIIYDRWLGINIKE